MGENTTPAHHRLKPHLKEIARRDRRALLAVSIVTIFIAIARVVPNEISTLGITLETSDQRLLVGAMLVVLVYFLGSFGVYAKADLTDWNIESEEVEVKAHVLRGEIMLLEATLEDIKSRIDGVQKERESDSPRFDPPSLDEQEKNLRKQRDATKDKIIFKQAELKLVLSEETIPLSRAVKFLEYYLPTGVGLLSVACLLTLLIWPPAKPPSASPRSPQPQPVTTTIPVATHSPPATTSTKP